MSIMKYQMRLHSGSRHFGPVDVVNDFNATEFHWRLKEKTTFIATHDEARIFWDIMASPHNELELVLISGKTFIKFFVKPVEIIYDPNKPIKAPQSIEVLWSYVGFKGIYASVHDHDNESIWSDL